MKKFFSLVMMASLIGNMQARQIKIDVTMPMEETRMHWRCDDLRMEVMAMPCPDDVCCVEMEVCVYEMTPEGERMICKPCVRTEWEKPACVRLASTDVCCPTEECIEVVARCCRTEKPCMKVEVTP